MKISKLYDEVNALLVQNNNIPDYTNEKNLTMGDMGDEVDVDFSKMDFSNNIQQVLSDLNPFISYDEEEEIIIRDLDSEGIVYVVGTVRANKEQTLVRIVYECCYAFIRLNTKTKDFNKHKTEYSRALYQAKETIVKSVVEQ